MQDSLEPRNVVAHIIHIFLEVIERDFHSGADIYAVASKFIEEKLRELNLAYLLSTPSYDSLQWIDSESNPPRLEKRREDDEPQDHFGQFYAQELDHKEKKKSGIV